MKTASAANIAHLALPATKFANCVKLKRADGTIVTFTDHDLPLSIDVSDGDGTLTYDANPGLILTATSASNALRADELELTGVTDDTAITSGDLRAGKYDKAEFKSFQINWSQVSDGPIKLGRYIWGEVRVEETRYRVEMRSLIDALSQPILDLFTTDCRATLGDSRCKVQLNPDPWTAGRTCVVRAAKEGAAPDLGSPSILNTVRPTVQTGFYYRCSVAGITGGSEPVWPTMVGATVVDGSVTWEAIRAYRQTGTVSFVSTQRAFLATGISDPTGASPAETWWGSIIWLTGLNAGLKREIISDDGLGSIGLRELAELTIVAGDTFTAEVRCDKSLATCRDRFDNLNNFRGEAYIPSPRTAFSMPAPSIPDIVRI